MVPVILELQATDKRVALQEARNEIARYESYESPDSASKRFEAKLLAFYEDKSLDELPPPPMAA
jgi:hypothetical protein